MNVNGKLGIALPLCAAAMAVGAGPAAAAIVTRVVDSTPASYCHAPYPNVAANKFTAIQPAIDASSPNDTVLVCPGTYSELVKIDRNTSNVVLNGLKVLANTTHLSTVAAPSTITGNDAIVTVSEAAKVTFSRFNVTGPGPSGCGSIKAGIWVRDGADATVSLNRVLNIRDNPLSGCQNGIGIQYGSADGATTGSGLIQSNEVSGYQKNGIVARSAGSTVTIDKNTVVGTGHTAVIAQNGIVLQSGALGRVTANKVNANWYENPSDPGTVATGLLTFSPSTALNTIQSNVLIDNQANLYVYDMDNGHVYTNQARNGQYGVVNDATSTNNRYDGNKASTNSIYDCEDDSSGAKTAGTANTWLNNRGTLMTPLGICKP